MQKCKHEWSFKETFDDDGKLLTLVCYCSKCKKNWNEFQTGALSVY